MDRDIEVVLTDAAIKHIEVSSFSATFGARPLKRWIDRVRMLALNRCVVVAKKRNFLTISLSLSLSRSPYTRNRILRRSCRRCC